MELTVLNTATDTRRWARTENDSSSLERPQTAPSPPSREDEQRYQQTAPKPSKEHA
jgi:hypothetical protein